MVHDEAHELKQNAALRMLARYLAELRASTRGHAELSPGDPAAELEQILGPSEAAQAEAAVLNREVPTPAEVAKLVASLPPSRTSKLPIAKKDPGDER
jgi:hypothetical protein